MSGSIVCQVPAPILEKLKEFRFRKEKTSAALILRLNRDKLEVEQEALLENTTLEELRDELPDTNPRYVVLSYVYQHADGRQSFPLVFFYWSPEGVKPETHMLYAGAKSHIVQKCEVGKVFDIRDIEDICDTWLRDKLKSIYR